MDIEIIRKEKEILRQKISELINDFELKTSVDVNSIAIESTYQKVPEDASPRLINKKIIIEAKI